ncbi:hypothetical protein H632_c497p0, partial [Helicosporidium sp. ATCC 50920]
SRLADWVCDSPESHLSRVSGSSGSVASAGDADFGFGPSTASPSGPLPLPRDVLHAKGLPPICFLEYLMDGDQLVLFVHLKLAPIRTRMQTSPGVLKASYAKRSHKALLDMPDSAEAVSVAPRR